MGTGFQEWRRQWHSSLARSCDEKPSIRTGADGPNMPLKSLDKFRMRRYAASLAGLPMLERPFLATATAVGPGCSRMLK